MLKDEWWFSYVNNVALATLDGGDEIAGFEPENVTNYKADNVWRVVDATMVLKGSLASQQPNQCLIIRVPPGTAWAEDDEATITFSNADPDSDDQGTWTVPLIADPFTGCVAYIDLSEVTAQYFKISMPNKDIEYIHLGPAFFPEQNYSKGPEVSPEDTTVTERSLFTSSKTIQEGYETDRFVGQFEVWNADEYQTWRDFARTVRLSAPFAFGISQTSQLHESYIAHLTDQIRFRPVDTRWLGQIQLEALR